MTPPPSPTPSTSTTTTQETTIVNNTLINNANVLTYSFAEDFFRNKADYKFFKSNVDKLTKANNDRQAAVELGPRIVVSKFSKAGTHPGMQVIESAETPFTVIVTPVSSFVTLKLSPAL